MSSATIDFAASPTAKRSTTIRASSCMLAWLLTTALVLLQLQACFAKLEVPSIYGDNMVLQTNNEYGARAFINGRSEPGEFVLVQAAGVAYNVTADANGDWKVMLNPHTSVEDSIAIKVATQSGDTWSASNVSYGDVFLCSGQSNMEFPLSISLNASSLIQDAANYPFFRIFTVAKVPAAKEQFDVQGQWDKVSPNNIGNFSAVCYLTAREISRLHTSTRPIGLIESNWGGTRVEAWMSPAALAKCPHPPLSGSNPQNQPSALWNGMIAPLTSITVRSVLWYQGEANSDNSTNYYSCMFQSMIRDWRDRFGVGDFAFNFVQLAPSVPPDAPPSASNGYPDVREAQRDSLPRPGGDTDISGMAVTIDLGGSSAWGYVHPPNKPEVGRRLALATLHTAYALQEQWGGGLRYTGPVINGSEAIRVDGGFQIAFEDFSATKLTFQAVNNCTTCCDIKPFEYNNGSSWQFANATLIGSSVIVKAPNNTQQIRYAWSNFVQCVLINNDSLPTSPFVINVSQNDVTTYPKHPHNPFIVEDAAIQSPPMGFNSWNFYHCNIDENIVREVGKAFIERGLRDAGYEYVNIDDCWQVARQQNQTIVPDPVRFPSGMARLAADIHAMKLKFGVYTARGSGTCQGRPGSLNFELIDAATYCDWKLDYLKIDGCKGAQDPKTSWSRFHDGFQKCFNQTGQFIVQSVESCDDPDSCGEWVWQLANLWRTGGDIQAEWQSVLENIKRNDIMADIARPGHFNDPDMLQVGNVGLSVTEQRSHFALWCITAAPLLIGTDVIHASNETIDILTTKGLIKVNQDLGLNGKIQGKQLKQANDAAPQVVVSSCSDTKSQKWKFSLNKLIQQSSNLCVDIQSCTHGPKKPGDPLILQDCEHPDGNCRGDNQQFEFLKNGSIVSKMDGRCLDIYEGKGPNVYAHDCVAQNNEAWSFDKDQRLVSKQGGLCLDSANPQLPYSTWIKYMSDKTIAVVMVNEDTSIVNATLLWADINLDAKRSAKVTDLWTDNVLGTYRGSFSSVISSHDNVAILVQPE